MEMRTVYSVAWTFGNNVKYRDYKTISGAEKCRDFIEGKGGDTELFAIRADDSDFKTSMGY